MEETVEDFWNMVLEHEVSCVVGIVELEFLGEKCAKYWPRSQGLKQFQDVVVKTLSSQANLLYEHKKLLVQISDKTRIIDHFYLF